MQQLATQVAILSVLLFVACCLGADYRNPVLEANNPDPGVLLYKGVYYAATTSGDAPDHFPIHSSTDLVHWKLRGYVFPAKSPTIPKWAVKDYWAPEIHHVNGKFNVYYVARDNSGMLCVGAAVSTSGSPLGPYRDIGEPLARNASMGYIDPTFNQFEESGKKVNYLYWKTDGNAIEQPTQILVQELAADGLKLKEGSEKRVLLTNRPDSWEGTVIEGPWVVKHQEEYFLFYSGNACCNGERNGSCLYAVGVAAAPTPTGPFVRQGNSPILTTEASANPVFTGPGHCSVVPFYSAGPDAQPEWYMVYHAWTFKQVAGGYARHMLTDKIDWSSRWPRVYRGYPSSTAQTIPEHRK